MARPLGRIAGTRTGSDNTGPRLNGTYTWRDPARITPQRRAQLEAHDRRYADPPGPRLSTRDAARQRDVPRTCTCSWHYFRRPARWERTIADTGCPWHAATTTGKAS